MGSYIISKTLRSVRAPPTPKPAEIGYSTFLDKVHTHVCVHMCWYCTHVCVHMCWYCIQAFSLLIWFVSVGTHTHLKTCRNRLLHLCGQGTLTCIWLHVTGIHVSVLWCAIHVPTGAAPPSWTRCAYVYVNTCNMSIYLYYIHVYISTIYMCISLQYTREKAFPPYSCLCTRTPIPQSAGIGHSIFVDRIHFLVPVYM